MVAIVELVENPHPPLPPILPRPVVAPYRDIRRVRHAVPAPRRQQRLRRQQWPPPPAVPPTAGLCHGVSTTAPSVATGTTTSARRYPAASHVGTAARDKQKTTGGCGNGEVLGSMRAGRRRGNVQEGCGPYHRSITERGRDWAVAATAATAGRPGSKTEGG